MLQGSARQIGVLLLSLCCVSAAYSEASAQARGAALTAKGADLMAIPVGSLVFSDGSAVWFTDPSGTILAPPASAPSGTGSGVGISHGGLQAFDDGGYVLYSDHVAAVREAVTKAIKSAEQIALDERGKAFDLDADPSKVHNDTCIEIAAKICDLKTKD